MSAKRKDQLNQANQRPVQSVRRRCPECRGEGVVERPLVEPPAGERPPDALWWEQEEALLGEGQMVVPDLVEMVSCVTCGGTGRVTVWLSAEEYRALHWRRLRRGLILLVLGLIPFLVLLGAILADPQMLCGRWWYGLGAFFLLVQFGKLTTKRMT